MSARQVWPAILSAGLSAEGAGQRRRAAAAFHHQGAAWWMLTCSTPNPARTLGAMRSCVQVRKNEPWVLPTHAAGNGTRPCAIYVLDLNEVAKKYGMPVCRTSDFAVDLDTQVLLLPSRHCRVPQRPHCQDVSHELCTAGAQAWERLPLHYQGRPAPAAGAALLVGQLGAGLPACVPGALARGHQQHRRGHPDPGG